MLSKRQPVQTDVIGSDCARYSARISTTRPTTKTPSPRSSGGPLEEHTAIYNAIRRGDAAAAAAHVDRTRIGYQEEVGRRVFRSGAE